MQLFPDFFQVNWQQPAHLTWLNSLPNRTSAWLLSADSMTTRLTHIQNQLSVEVVRQQWLEENRGQFWRRDVFLRLNHQPYMFAQTLIPRTVVSCLPFDVRRLQETPIGRYLFSIPTIQLQQLLCGRVKPTVLQRQYPQYRDHFETESPFLLGRQRVFSASKSSHCFAVIEFFLAPLADYLAT
ncbi:MAG: chorismate lyase [Shewanellaceae bacterium]|nr:chorismate lyase [Shewanellaceae bacterium]